jgi:3',5'-cyclic AMP phosphodiesterase CpdA
LQNEGNMISRFVVLSDTHFSTTGRDGVWWNRSTERQSARMGEALVSLVTVLAPDFAVHCGDFTSTGTAEEFAFAKDILDRLGCPWFAVPGNHDTWTAAGRDWFREAFDTGDGAWSYVRELGGLRFVFLDAAHWHGADGSVSPALDRRAYDAGEITGMGPSEEDIAVLENAIDETTSPVMVVSHAPVSYRDMYPVATLPRGGATHGPMTPPADFIADIVGRSRLLDIVRGSPKVTAWLAGHWHINDIVEDRGAWHIMTGALREYPFDIRLVEFDGSSFHVTTHRLDVPDLLELSYVREWGNRWVEGGAADRTAVLSVRSLVGSQSTESS